METHESQKVSEGGSKKFDGKKEQKDVRVRPMTAKVVQRTLSVSQSEKEKGMLFKK